MKDFTLLMICVRVDKTEYWFCDSDEQTQIKMFMWHSDFYMEIYIPLPLLSNEGYVFTFIHWFACLSIFKMWIKV